MKSLLRVWMVLLILWLSSASVSNLQAQSKDLLNKQLLIESNNSHTNSKGKIWESSAGALGVAQFMPQTWDWLINVGKIPNHYDITSEAHQREAHKIFMQYLFEYNYGVSYDQESLAFASYNAGVHRVKRLVVTYGKSWKSYLPRETQSYLANLNL